MDLSLYVCPWHLGQKRLLSTKSGSRREVGISSKKQEQKNASHRWLPLARTHFHPTWNWRAPFWVLLRLFSFGYACKQKTSIARQG